MASQCSTARHWPWVVLVAVVLAVAPAYATNSVTSVSHDTAVKGVSRTVTFTGPGVAPGDRVFWMDNRPDCDVIPINSEGVLVLDQSNSVQVTFDTVSTPLYPFRLCYRFGSTPYQRYITMMMEVKVRAVLCGVVCWARYAMVCCAGAVDVPRVQMFGRACSTCDTDRVQPLTSKPTTCPCAGYHKHVRDGVRGWRGQDGTVLGNWRRRR